MGRRQRDTGLIHLSDEELLALLADPNTPEPLRTRAIAEAKFRGLRNVGKDRGKPKWR